MRPTLPTAAALLIALGAAAGAARAEPGDAIERAVGSGVLERAVATALSRIDFDALITGFEQQAQAAAEGRAGTESDALARARGQMEEQARQAGPQLARGAAGLIGPVLREIGHELRAELGAELGADIRPEAARTPTAPAAATGVGAQASRPRQP